MVIGMSNVSDDESDGMIARLMEYAGTTYVRESQIAAENRSITPLQLHTFAVLAGFGIAVDVAAGAAFEVVDLYRAARNKITGASRRGA